MAMILRGSVYVPASRERAWDLWVDAARYPAWQGGVLAVLDPSGPVSDAGTTFVLDHGPKLKRRVRVVTAERPALHVIEQTGVGVHDQAVATFEAEGAGTRLTLAMYMHLNPVMRVLMLLDRTSRSERELQRELDRFAALAERRPGPMRRGGTYLARAGAVRRRVTVIDIDPDRVHVRLQPGHLRNSDPDATVPAVPKPPGEQMDLWPIPPPLRGGHEITAMGLPFLLRDGGHGVAHLALTLDAWADADTREVVADDAAPTEADAAAVTTWRMRGTPAIGLDVGLALAPVCTLRLGRDHAGSEVWGVAKVLLSEILRVHLAIYPERWMARPERIDAWRYHATPIGEDDGPIRIGHLPLNRAAFSAAKPRFAGVATLETDELQGYRYWRDHKGGTFDTLDVVGT